MKKIRCSYYRLLSLIILITILASLFLIRPIPFAQKAAAEHREFEVKKFEEKITIPSNNYQAIDINFQEGKKLEVIFTLQVKQDLPIDIWFVNEDNYMLLSGGAQFLYFMDGTAQQISYTKKIVTLSAHENYKLVMTNYYNSGLLVLSILLKQNETIIHGP